jgi:hypothetical protein
VAAHFDQPEVSNGPTENLKLKIKNTKRIARGYRNFDHYRLRLLLNHGRIHEDHSPTRIRTRAPKLAAQSPSCRYVTRQSSGADETLHEYQKVA